MRSVIGSACASFEVELLGGSDLSGAGMEPDIVTWGRMLNGGRLYLGSTWWITSFPGLAIFLTVLAVNLLGDYLRDWLDPRLRNTVRGDQL